MDFEKELDKRLESVYQQEKEEQKRAEEWKKKQALILKTKNIIDPILQTVAKKFNNAKTEPTHEVEPSGEIVFRFGTGTCCFIDFDNDKKYGFPEPCRVGFQVEVDDLENESIKILHAYVSGRNCLENYKAILDTLRRKSNVIFSGKFNREEIKQAVEKAILETLDSVRVNQ